jgi:hypothetical protein
MGSVMRRQPVSSLAILGFVLAFLLPLFGLIVSVWAIHDIDCGPTERHWRGQRGRELALTGVAIAGLLMLVALGILAGSV